MILEAMSDFYKQVMFRSAYWFCLAILFFGLCLPSASRAAALAVDSVTSNLSVNVTSFYESRFISTVKQEHDFSCGSAAVATLLSYHYEHPVTETEVFKAMYEVGDKELIRRSGFSLLDIKRFLISEGYKSDGFRISLDRLMELSVPAIALVNDGGYKHFVVIKGVDKYYVLVGDPAKGTRYIKRNDFSKIWSGIMFLIKNKKDIASQYFASNDVFGLVAKAPIGSVMSRSVMQDSHFILPHRFEF